MTRIDWVPATPRSGLMGQWDKFVGPGATPHEEWLQLLSSLFLTTLLLLLLYAHGYFTQWTPVQTLIVVLLAFDLVGGVITNATSTAKRWYHRAGQDGLAAHLPFIAVHGIHLLLIAVFFRQMDWMYIIVLYGYLLIATLLLTRFPLYLQRPAGMALFCGAVLLGWYVLTPTPGLEWFVPLFYLKLLVCHLLKEAPFSPDNPA
jgi:hypothetical protein